MRSAVLWICAGLTVLPAGCATVPQSALAPSSTLLADRAMQSRAYQTAAEDRVLAACAGVLQDMGFLLDESDTSLGLIAGSKLRSAHDLRQKVAHVVLGALTMVYAPTDKEQLFRASVTTHPVQGSRVVVRVTFQRIVWDTQGNISRRQALKDPAYYRDFFERLSKAVFLDAESI